MSDCYYRVGEPGFQSGTGSFSFFSNRMPYQAVGFQFHVITFPFTRRRVRNAHNISSFFPTETGNMRHRGREPFHVFAVQAEFTREVFPSGCVFCLPDSRKKIPDCTHPVALCCFTGGRNEVGSWLAARQSHAFFCVTQMIQTKSMQKLHKKRKILTLVLDICIKIWYNITEQKKWKGHGGNHD